MIDMVSIDMVSMLSLTSRQANPYPHWKIYTHYFAKEIIMLDYPKIRRKTTGSDPVWILSGLALASCGGGGGGGGGSSLVLTGDFRFTPGPTVNSPLTASHAEHGERIQTDTAEETWNRAVANFPGSVGRDLHNMGVRFDRAEVVSTTVVTEYYDVPGSNVQWEWTATLMGDDVDDFMFVAVPAGDDYRVVTVAAPDFENPQDADQNNVYEVTIRGRVTDHPLIDDNLEGQLNDDDDYHLTITDVTVNDPQGNQPSIAPSKGGFVTPKRAASSDPANRTYELNIEVDEGDTLIDLSHLNLINPTIIGGDDQDHVQISQTKDGVIVEFVSAPDYEAEADYNQDNVYEFIILDGTLTIEVDVTVVDI
jgi:hypothetical protein